MINNQMRTLGLSLDWSRQYFTMDDVSILLPLIKKKKDNCVLTSHGWYCPTLERLDIEDMVQNIAKKY